MMQGGSRHCATMAPFVRTPKGERGVGEFLRVERRGKIAILTMNKPESMNAIGTPAACDDIVDTLRALGEDRGIRAIIQTSSGKAFSAGGHPKRNPHQQGTGKLESPDSARANSRNRGPQDTHPTLACESPITPHVNNT